MASKETILRVIRELQNRQLLGPKESVSGDNWSFSCPFRHNHNGKVRQNTPSFAIHMENGYWNCFSKKCGAGGKSIHTLFSRLTGISEEEAKDTIGDEVMPLGALQEALESLGKKEDEHPMPLAPWPDPVVPVFDSPLALAYLEKRRVPADLAHSLGAVVFTGHALTTYEGKSVRGERLILPVDYRGERIGYSARGFHDWQKPKYFRPISNMNSCVFNPGKISPKTHDKVFVVEGELDAYVCLRESMPAVCTFNAGTSPAQARFLAGFKQVIYLYDPDESGVAGADKAIAKYRGAFATTRKFNMPKGMDPGDMPLGFGARHL